MALQASALAATTFSGQNFGAKKFDRLREGMKVSLIIVFGISFVLSLIAYFLASPLIAIFNPDPDVVAYGADFLKILSLGIWSFGLSETISGFIRGSGHAMGPMLISLLTICILRLVVVYFAMPIFNSIRVISIIYPVSYFANLVIMALYFKFGSWRKDFEM